MRITYQGRRRPRHNSPSVLMLSLCKTVFHSTWRQQVGLTLFWGVVFHRFTQIWTSHIQMAEANRDSATMFFLKPGVVWSSLPHPPCDQALPESHVMAGPSCSSRSTTPSSNRAQHWSRGFVLQCTSIMFHLLLGWEIYLPGKGNRGYQWKLLEPGVCYWFTKFPTEGKKSTVWKVLGDYMPSDYMECEWSQGTVLS